MQRLLLSLLALLAATLGKAQIDVSIAADFEPGEPCDTARYLVYYDLRMVEDTVNAPDIAVKETMRLELGDHVSLFYSQMAYQADSANAVVMKNGGNSYSGGGKISWRLYKNYPTEGKTALLERLGMDRFVCTEDYAAPAWRPVADSSAVILGYRCSLATAAYKGRTWYAWYAEDIPLDAGPWKLGGLPGLILRAYDAPRHYVFDAVGMSEVAPPAPIYYKGVKYEAVSRKQLEGIRRRYFADPVGYITNNPNVTVQIRDEQGNEVANPKNEPYNSIEVE